MVKCSRIRPRPGRRGRAAACGITSSAMSRMDSSWCALWVSFRQSVAVIRMVPKGPTSSRSARICSRHRVRVAGDGERVAGVLGRHVLVRHLRPALHDGVEGGALHQRHQVAVVVGERPCGVAHVIPGPGVVVRHEDGAGDAPVRRPRLAAARRAALREALPVVPDGGHRHEVGRDHAPAPRRGRPHAARIRAHGRGHERRVRLLVGLDHGADAEVGPVVVLEPERPVLAPDVVGRLRGPELEHGLDGLARHLAADLQVGHAEHLEVADEPAGAHAQDQPPVAQVIQQGGVGGGLHRVALRQVDHAGAELHARRARDQVGEEHEGAGHRLAQRRVVLADPELVEAEAVAGDRDLHVLLQHRVGVPPVIVHRHHEHAELHPALIPQARSPRPGLRPAHGLKHGGDGREQAPRGAPALNHGARLRAGHQHSSMRAAGLAPGGDRRRSCGRRCRGRSRARHRPPSPSARRRRSSRPAAAPAARRARAAARPGRSCRQSWP